MNPTTNQPDHNPTNSRRAKQQRVHNGPPLAGHGAQAVRDAIAESITTLPQQLRRSLTWDQGTEMAQHAQLRIDTNLDIYFCDPQAPWNQRAPTVCSANTSPKAPISADTPETTWTLSPQL